MRIVTPEIETYKEAEIIRGIICNETLDIVKSLTDFDGKMETYVLWRRAAHIAYKVYEEYDGSTIMTNDSALAARINKKYRENALRVFITGVKKNIYDLLFPAKPIDLPTALALAQKAEANSRELCRNTEDKGKKPGQIP